MRPDILCRQLDSAAQRCAQPLRRTFAAGRQSLTRAYSCYVPELSMWGLLKGIPQCRCSPGLAGVVATSGWRPLCESLAGSLLASVLRNCAIALLIRHFEETGNSYEQTGVPGTAVHEIQPDRSCCAARQFGCCQRRLVRRCAGPQRASRARGQVGGVASLEGLGGGPAVQPPTA